MTNCENCMDETLAQFQAFAREWLNLSHKGEWVVVLRPNLYAEIVTEREGLQRYLIMMLDYGDE